jgi:hypothetical protein
MSPLRGLLPGWGVRIYPGLSPPGYMMSPLRGSLPGWVGLRSTPGPGALAAGLDDVAAPRLIARLGCTHLPGAHARGLYDVAALRLLGGGVTAAAECDRMNGLAQEWDGNSFPDLASRVPRGSPDPAVP